MRVRAPGSSANLGPGFDVLGLAVARYVWVADDGDGPPCGPDHIARIAYEQAGGTEPIWFDFELEPGRGLGFSAAARAGGAFLAAVQQGCDPTEAQERAYRVVADIEGHGDNAAPSVFGGLHLIAGDRNYRIGPDLPGRLLFWVPDLAILTDESRASLPGLVSRADCVFNLGRIALLMMAIYEQRLDLLAEAIADRLHQPQRFAECDAAAAAYEAALEAGATAAWLSGSGPTIGVVTSDDTVEPVTTALSETGKVLDLAVDRDGAVLVTDGYGR